MLPLGKIKVILGDFIESNVSQRPQKKGRSWQKSILYLHIQIRHISWRLFI